MTLSSGRLSSGYYLVEDVPGDERTEYRGAILDPYEKVSPAYPTTRVVSPLTSAEVA